MKTVWGSVKPVRGRTRVSVFHRAGQGASSQVCTLHNQLFELLQFVPVSKQATFLHLTASWFNCSSEFVSAPNPSTFLYTSQQTALAGRVRVCSKRSYTSRQTAFSFSNACLFQASECFYTLQQDALTARMYVSFKAINVFTLHSKLVSLLEFVPHANQSMFLHFTANCC